MPSLLFIIAIVLAVYFWWDTMRSKEAARQSAKATCERLGLQFLDDTVSLEKLSWRRNNHGRLMFSRLYSFEFTSDASQRYQGNLRVWDGIASDIVLPPYRESNLDE